MDNQTVEQQPIDNQIVDQQTKLGLNLVQWPARSDTFWSKQSLLVTVA